MPVHTKITDQFCYISYTRSSFRDTELLKRALADMNRADYSLKDVVVDFTYCNSVSSAEIAGIVRLQNALQNTSRTIRCIMSSGVRSAFQSTNLDKLSNVIFYPDQKTFLVKAGITSDKT